MGLNERTEKTYLRISYGSIARTVDKDTPKAVERVKKDGTKIYELKWESITGQLQNVEWRQSQEYGNSWNLEINDVGEVYILQIQEDSRYGSDFMKKLPNLQRDALYTFKPFDYEKDGKRKVGIFITGTGEERIDSYYQKFEQTSDGWNVTNLHGFPDFRGNAKDADDLKIYFLQVTKFLREQGQKFLRNSFVSAPQAEIGPAVEPELPSNTSDSLPF